MDGVKVDWTQGGQAGLQHISHSFQSTGISVDHYRPAGLTVQESVFGEVGL